MAEQYDNTNSFAMFKNEKGDNDQQDLITQEL